LFLYTVIALGVLAASIELYLYCRFNLLRKGIDRWAWIGTLLAFTVVTVICTILGALGIIVTLASIVSLCITQPIFLMYSIATSGKLDFLNPKGWVSQRAPRVFIRRRFDTAVTV